MGHGGSSSGSTSDREVLGSIPDSKKMEVYAAWGEPTLIRITHSMSKKVYLYLIRGY